MLWLSAAGAYAGVADYSVLVYGSVVTRGTVTAPVVVKGKSSPGVGAYFQCTNLGPCELGLSGQAVGVILTIPFFHSAASVTVLSNCHRQRLYGRVERCGLELCRKHRPGFLPDDVSVQHFYDNSMTVALCVERCGNAGYAMAGVRSGDCYCGNEAGRYGLSSSCGYTCAGDSGEVGRDVYCGTATGTPSFSLDVRRWQRFERLLHGSCSCMGRNLAEQQGAGECA